MSSRHEQKYVRNLAVWPMAACLRYRRRTKQSAQVPFVSRYGRRRLVTLATRAGSLLAVHATLEDWDQFLLTLAHAAIEVAERIISEGGTAAAVELVLCILGDEGFRRNQRYQTDFVVARLSLAIQRRRHDLLKRRLVRYFNRPPE